MGVQESTRIEEIVRHLRDRLNGDGRAYAERFVRQFYDRVPPEDLTGTDTDRLYAMALSFWRFGAERKTGTITIRAFNPTLEEHGWTSAHSVIEIVNDDMPFLLDSLLGELTQRGLGVHVIIHPVLALKRDSTGTVTGLLESGAGSGALAESWMHIQIDARSNEKACREITDAIESVFGDVRSAVDDWRPMLAKLEVAVAELNVLHDDVSEHDFAEARAFIEWIGDDHFVFMGYREYAYDKTAEDPFRFVEGSGLGILTNPKLHVLRGAGGTGTSPAARGFLESVYQPLMITKTSTRSVVHRAGHMDYLGVKRFNVSGELVGEHRFVGLFSSAAYNRSPRAIPLLRRKVMVTLERAGLSPVSHDGKALISILETFPRDELFQIPEDELAEFSFGILHLQERPRIKLFFRREQFGRFVSCLVFVPREVHTTKLRKRFEMILEEAFGGTVSSQATEIGGSPLARNYIVIALTDNARPLPVLADVEDRLVQAARTWDDELHDELIGQMGEDRGNRLDDLYRNAFTGAYCESFTTREALADIEIIEGLGDGNQLALNMYRPVEAATDTVRFKIYHAGSALALSDFLPMIENMGLRVLEERPYQIARDGNAENIWLHDLLLVEAGGSSIDLGAVKKRFQTTFAKVWNGEVEDDGFNRLIVGAGLTWREVVILRAYAKYLRQAGATYSQAYIEATLAENPGIAARLVEMFHARFDPVQAAHQGVRATELGVEIVDALDQVSNLDQDRILRRFLNLCQSTQRTNYFQPSEESQGQHPRHGGKAYVSFKIDSRMVEDLPLPRPFAEIFLYSPRVEAVHLRGGMVARGGIRWSDRREDFRTEVLGLMKAQMTKNAVIVPVGSKGGFVTKRLPTEGGREAIRQEVVACYRIMMHGMLDLTDNYGSEGVLYPPDVVRHDGDDPYLVVAADKGTASFSDIANEISESFGFWLGDAFASGGSAGYDHKKMGITARGAWESVKRHFREIGIDTQIDEFTVIGVGDMSGDVFGNGMLLSEHICLLAAFNHLHIFIDPTPDAAASYSERKRLFETPGSSWSDYDPALISEGGGVFDRSAKSIKLTPHVRQLIGADRNELTPAELIRALLKTETDLLWLGGIGTYVRAKDETNADVGDRASDTVRVTAPELRCRVVGEGANLGFTQRARVEYGLAGGRINTDAIDNSAGVDTSDREVNIKILLGTVVADGEMTRKQRDRLLADMTDEVAALVLRDNYLQAQAITLAESEAAAHIESHARFMHTLGRAGRLDRDLEYLPDDETIAERQTRGKGLARPEFAILLAYSKISLFEDLLESDVPGDPYLEVDLIRYFPEPMRAPYVEAIKKHRLRRQIIANHVSNNLVNRAGITFVSDIAEETGCSVANATRSYLVAREAFGMRPLWKAVEALDNQVATEVQSQMNLDLMELHRLGTLWFVRNLAKPTDIISAIDDFGPAITELWDGLTDLHTRAVVKKVLERSEALLQAGVPGDLAERIGRAAFMGAACHIVSAMHQVEKPVTDVAATYFALGERLGLDWLRIMARDIRPKDHWEQRAITAIVEDLNGQQCALTARVFKGANGAVGAAAIETWVEQHAAAVDWTSALISEFKGAGSLDLARLAIVNRYMRNIIMD